MLRSVIIFVFLLLAMVSWAQSPIAINRNSKISLVLLKKEKRTFKLSLSQNDIIRFNLKAIKGLNFRFIDVEGQIIIERLIKKSAFIWRKRLKLTGFIPLNLKIPLSFFLLRLMLRLCWIEKTSFMARETQL